VALGLVETSDSTPPLSPFYPPRAVFEKAGHYVSKFGSAENPPRLSLKFRGVVVMRRFVLLSDIKNCHQQRREPPARMRSYVTGLDDQVQRVDDDIVFYEDKAWKNYKTPIGPFTGIVFEMVNPPQSTMMWTLRLSEIEIFGKFLP
jgi:hypothetical protein